MIGYKVVTAAAACAAVVSAAPTFGLGGLGRCGLGLFWWGPKGSCLPGTTRRRTATAGSAGTGTILLATAFLLTQATPTPAAGRGGAGTLARTPAPQSKATTRSRAAIQSIQ
ncbi:hypothetical protein RhiJN_25578 [Ceratobasidium sp. AG-Ba]|nr:hypothetical protein RhiJN_25578 [Ceratobasidium sp. AG-Ba]